MRVDDIMSDIKELTQNLFKAKVLLGISETRDETNHYQECIKSIEIKLNQLKTELDNKTIDKKK